MNKSVSEAEVLEYVEKYGDLYPVDELYSPVEEVLCPGMLFEKIFYKRGMTLYDYVAETIYITRHIKDVRDRTYKPLWKQAQT